MSTKQRKHLNDYTDAARQIELAGACINVLEMMRGTTAERCIKALRAEQQRSLTRLDKAAERLGAPYPSPPLVYGGTDGGTDGGVGY